MRDRTGKGITDANMTDYFCDHYGVKVFNPLLPLVTKKNFILWQTPSDEADSMKKVICGVKQSEEPTCLRDFYCGAAFTQQVQVGQAHKLAVFTDACITIRKDLPVVQRQLTGTEGNELAPSLVEFAISNGDANTALSLAIYEPYEVCLGGYGFGISKAIKLLSKAMIKGEGDLQAKDAEAAGINVTQLGAILQAANGFHTGSSLVEIKSEKGNKPKLTVNCLFSDDEFVLLMAYMSYLIGSGHWTPLAPKLVGARMMLYGWLVLHPAFAGVRYALRDNLVVRHIVDHVSSYLTAVGKSGFKYKGTPMCCSKELHLFS